MLYKQKYRHFCLESIHVSDQNGFFIENVILTRENSIKFQLIFEPVREKTNNLGFEQVRHKAGCTITEKGKKLEISDLRRRGIVLSE